MNIATLFLAVAAAISVNSTVEPSPNELPCSPMVEMWDGGSVQLMDIEECVIACVAHEVPYTFHRQALMAQAVAARTYLLSLIESPIRNHPAGEVCTDAGHCMGYITKETYAAKYGTDAAEKAFEAARAAAEETRGKVMTYDGKIINALWHSSSSGSTEDSGEVFLTSLPYLSPVSTPETAAVCEVRFTHKQVKELCRTAGFNVRTVLPTSVIRTASGRCKTLFLGRTAIDGCNVRRIFSLPSTDFDAVSTGGELIFTVRGYGHGVGMSQYGANALAESGWEYERILTHYYSGAVLTGWNESQR